MQKQWIITVLITLLCVPQLLSAQQIDGDFNKDFFKPPTAKVFIDSPKLDGQLQRSKDKKKGKQRYQIPEIFDIRNVEGFKAACDQVVLAEKRKPYSQMGYGVCLGYIKGVKNSYDITNKHLKGGKICFPREVTWLQLISAFINWEKDQKDAKDMLAWTGLINAFSRYYPCQPELIE